ncbi:MAG: YqhG family protein [Alicyclobacillus sp.]|nr:YqhG family protein [Alicyclobacillus sp.]
MTRSSTELPLRSEPERIRFCDAYFGAVGAPTLYAADAYREYELPRDVDKELTDRPYYWMWVERTQQTVKPTVLRLAFNPAALARENERLRQQALAEQSQQANGPAPQPGWWFRPPAAELITLGSFRLDKIFQSLDIRGRFACVRLADPSPRDRACSGTPGTDGGEFQATSGGRTSPRRWVPWLMVNALISYRCDLVEQLYLSVGCCLTNGQVVESFHRHIRHLDMIPASPQELLGTATLSWSEALALAQKQLERAAQRKPADWAAAASRRLEQELRQLRTYYRSILPDIPERDQPLVTAEQQRKERELVERMQPRIEIAIRQLAVVGLAERTAHA